jgi:hypothetical protein
MKRIEGLRAVVTLCIIVNVLMVLFISQNNNESKSTFWLVLSISSALLIWAIVFIVIDGIVLLSKNAEKSIELAEYQQKVLTAQLHLLAGIADKSGVPVADINEFVTEFGVEYE